MAHELRNPLQAMMVNLEVVRMRVGRGAPEVWSDVERFAEAVDANARLLNRRLRLALDIARRAPDDPLETRDLRTLVEDLCGALRMDEEHPRVTVAGAERGATGVEARAGYLVDLLVRLLDAARAAAVDASVEARVTEARDGGSVTLELSPEGAADLPGGGVELAERAGGRLTRAEGSAGRVWRLELPTA
jgi:signal transduction histidine kinase